VEVLAEEDTTPAPGEMARLHLPDGPAFVRRVALGRPGCPLVLARTVMPPPTLRGEGRRLRNLGDTPLGELVFADFAATRSEFELASLAPPSPLFPELDAACWARRSVLHLATGPILVTEAFLPAFPGSGVNST
jgi:chorismate--pyruvate lyase